MTNKLNRQPKQHKLSHHRQSCYTYTTRLCRLKWIYHTFKTSPEEPSESSGLGVFFLFFATYFLDGFNTWPLFIYSTRCYLICVSWASYRPCLSFNAFTSLKHGFSPLVGVTCLYTNTYISYLFKFNPKQLIYKLVSTLLVRPIRLFWKFDCLFHKDSQYTGVCTYCSVVCLNIDSNMLRIHLFSIFIIKTPHVRVYNRLKQAQV